MIKRHLSHRQSKFYSKLLKDALYLLLGLTFTISALFIVWIATIKLPDFNNFEDRKIENSTKIYDRTGKILLYNIYQNVKRTQIKNDQISDYIKKATIAIEDSDFYNHFGIRPTSIIRAVLISLKEGRYAQGGSTITQQVVKNALLTKDKTIVRKVKEWVLAIKLDAQVSKDDILNIYLNESPYGGTIYGVEEASLSYYGKHASEVTLAEAAYLAAMPQAPSRYSPFNNDKSALENRKNLVLARMLELGVINKDEFDKAKAEKIEFKSRENSDGKAYHFVFYVREYLENKYGKDVVENGGLKVITTLDYDLQKKAEEVTKEGALNNAKKFGAGNSALIALDPKTGQILSMVGSRDYFDTEIDGKFNVALAPRQPGSTFKPFVYTLAFMAGLSPSTVLFDIPTEFSTTCDAYGNPTYAGAKCYMPVSYDGGYHGPTDLRHALQWSLNIPAVKLQYIVGLQNTLDFVKKLGISTLGSASRYGLSLVLGGGEVTLLELTNAYGVYANNGYLNPTTPILEVTDNEGNTLEKYTSKSTFAIPKEYTDTINNVLSDPYARVPAFSVNNPINFYDRQVAAKTGTTNDFKDVWVIGYTPSIVVGMWGGNNDNAPVTRLAGTVLSPVWRKFMNYALLNLPDEKFDPDLTDRSASPDFIKGIYCHDGQAHTILAEMKGFNDGQYNLWNTPIQDYMTKNGCPYDATVSTSTDLIDNGTVNSNADLNMVNQVNSNTTIIPTTTSN